MTDRVFDRIPLSLEVEYRTAGAFLVAYTSNLSKGGLFIETERPVPVGTVLMLSFTIPSGERLQVRAVVAWLRPQPSEGKPAGMGVEFEGLDAHHGEIIDRIAGAFRGLSIMIVCPSPQARAVLARAVRSILSSAEVLEVDSADAAEAGFARDPDLVIVDLDEREAGEALYALRLAKRSPRQLPVIAASRDEESRQRARDLGADKVVPTPLVVPDLQACILRALGRPLRVT